MSIGSFKILPWGPILLSASLLTQPLVSLTIGTRLRRKRRNSMTLGMMASQPLWQDLTHLLFISKVLLEYLYQERELVITVEILNTEARNAQETGPILHPKPHAHSAGRCATGRGARKFSYASHVNGWLMGPGPPKAPKKIVIITWEEQCVTINVASKFVQFLVDMGATYSVLTSHSGTLAHQNSSVVSVEGRPKPKCLTMLLTCTWGETLINCKFLPMLECPSPLLGRDFL